MNVVENYAAILGQAGPLDLLFFAVMHFGPLFALIVGRRLERAVAAASLALLVIAWGTTDMGRPPPPDRYAAFSIAYLFVMAAIALRRGAPAWTLFAAAFQLLHALSWVLGLAAQIHVQNFAFMTILRIWTYLFVFSLVIGAWNSRRGSPGPRSAGGAGAQHGAAAGGARG